MSKFDQIQQHLSTHIDQLSEILEIESRKLFLIIDYEKEKQSFIIIAYTDQTCTIKIKEIEQEIQNFDTAKIFTVNNPNQKEVGFIPIDGKNGLIGLGNSCCDFVIFNENDFCFVELKLNTTSERKINTNLNQAVEQLEKTIEYFDNKLHNNYLQLNLEAYICFSQFYQTYPRFSPSSQSARRSFQDKNEILLFLENQKTFT